MTDKSAGPGDWSGVWVDAQRKYWESWLDLSRRSVEAAPGAAGAAAGNPWTQSLDAWTKLVMPMMPADARGTTGTVVGMAQGYLRTAEEFWKVLQAAQSAADAGASWKAAVQQGMDQLRQSFSSGVGQGADPWSPGDVDQAFRSQGAMSHPGETLRGEISRALATPPLGYTREWQESAQQWGQLWLEHGQALQEYAALLNKVGERAIELMSAKLVDMAKKDEQLDSMRALYNAWTDCGEEAYAEVAPTAGFTGLQARLVNTMMALKRHEQCMVDETLGSMNMPTRRELDTAHRRIHELRGQCRRTGEALEALDVPQLRQELEKLRAAVAAQQTSAAEAAQPTPTPAAPLPPRAQKSSGGADAAQPTPTPTPAPKRRRTTTKPKRT
jgi:class III poly(R)-hydroxyalkanoic acid synthase PhaE subunit